MSFEVVERCPTVAEHQTLWEAAGWGDVDTLVTERSLMNSVYGVVAVCDGVTVGMGRIVGDGAMYYYIQDVAVLPNYRQMGIGKRIMENLLQYIRHRAMGSPFVGLFASQGKEAFYEQFGFKNYAPGMTGMFTVMNK
nr:GNAT family N-acetyltransferase [Paenibacillus pinihumi]